MPLFELKAGTSFRSVLFDLKKQKNYSDGSSDGAGVSEVVGLVVSIFELVVVRWSRVVVSGWQDSIQPSNSLYQRSLLS